MSDPQDLRLSKREKERWKKPREGLKREKVKKSRYRGDLGKKQGPKPTTLDRGSDVKTTESRKMSEIFRPTWQCAFFAVCKSSKNKLTTFPMPFSLRRIIDTQRERSP